MELKIFNSLGKNITKIDLAKEKKISVYLCGPTVYDNVHIGNMRPAITFDVLVRLLKYLGLEVNYVSNITDIDDKIIQKAIEAGCSEEQITQLYTDNYFQILEKFNVEPANNYPKVTNYLAEIKDFIEELENKRKTYIVEEGVVFDTKKQVGYGVLSGQIIEQLRKKNNSLFLEEKKK